MQLSDRTWLRPKEFSEVFGFSSKHCYCLLARGLLPASKRRGIGWLINRRLFERDLEAGIEMKG